MLIEIIFAIALYAIVMLGCSIVVIAVADHMKRWWFK